MFLLGSDIGSFAKTSRRVFSTDTTISRASNVAESLTCLSSSDPTEIFFIPAGVIANIGDELLLDICGAIYNNDGSSRTISATITIDNTIVTSSGAGLSISSTSGGNRFYSLKCCIRRTGTATASVLTEQFAGGASGAGTLTQGTQYGGYTVGTLGSIFSEGVAFDYSVDHILKASAIWAVTSSNLYVNPRERSLYIKTY